MLTVGQAMHRKFHCGPPNRTVREAAVEMARLDIGLMVVTQDGQAGSPIVGVFSERDALKKIVAAGLVPADTPLTHVMSSPVLTVIETTPLLEAWKTMDRRRFRHLPVVDEARTLVGILSVRDVITCLAASASEKVVESFFTELRQICTGTDG